MAGNSSKINKVQKRERCCDAAADKSPWNAPTYQNIHSIPVFTARLTWVWKRRNNKVLRVTWGWATLMEGTHATETGASLAWTASLHWRSQWALGLQEPFKQRNRAKRKYQWSEGNNIDRPIRQRHIQTKLGSLWGNKSSQCVSGECCSGKNKKKVRKSHAQDQCEWIFSGRLPDSAEVP